MKGESLVRYYLVTTSFPGCLAEDGHVVNSLREASDSVREYISSYEEAHKFIYDAASDKDILNPDFSVERLYATNNKSRLCGAYVKWSNWGGGINISVNEIDANTAKEWDHQ